MHPEPRWQAQGHRSPLPLGSLAREPRVPAPATCPASQSQDSLGPVGLETPHDPANWGAFFPHQIAMETTLLCRQREGRPGKGKIQVPAPAQASPSPSWAQGQRHRSSSWLDRASLREEAWEKNLRYLSLRVKKTQEQPCWGGGPRVESWGKTTSLPRSSGSGPWEEGLSPPSIPASPRPNRGVQRPWSWKWGCRRGQNPAFGRDWGTRPGVPLLGCWFCFALKSRLL